MLTISAIVLVLFLTILITRLINLIKYLSIRNKLPPGPKGYPIVGCLPYLKANTTYLTLTDWVKQYGSLISFYCGDRLIVVLGDVQTMKEALIKQAETFAGRPRFHFVDVTHEYYGLVWCYGPLWKEQRRFALSTLRDFGLGRPILENWVREEFDSICKEIKSWNGEERDIEDLLNNSVSNIICSMAFGKRFQYGDEKFEKLLQHLNFMAVRGGSNIFSPFNFFPILRYLPQIYPHYRKVVDAFQEILKFCRDLSADHEEEYCKENEPSDYIHAFLKSRDSHLGNHFTERQLIGSIQSLFAAGTETTATTLRWGILYMCYHPEIQAKVRKELHDVIGPKNLPTSADRLKLPYTDATIWEIQRIGNISPLSIPHTATKDTYINGYLVPADTIVVPLLWYLHRNPEYFPEPEVFKPERFLDDNDTVIRNEALVPFSIGKRACPGEGMARMELLVTFCGLIQNFNWRFPEGKEVKDPSKRIFGITSCPENYFVIADPL